MKRNQHAIRKVAEGIYTYRGEEIVRNDGVPSATYGRWLWKEQGYTYRHEIVAEIDKRLNNDAALLLNIIK